MLVHCTNCSSTQASVDGLRMVDLLESCTLFLSSLLPCQLLAWPGTACYKSAVQWQ